MRKSLGVVALAFCAMGTRAAAQQSSLDLHASYARATVSKSNAWGAGASYQLAAGGKKAPLQLNSSVGADYMKQDNGGPSQTSVSYDGTLQPGGSGTVTPYAGGSVSANWSGGSNKQWDGAKLGLEAIAGLQVKLGLSGVSWKVEERYGYVREQQDHTLTTRVGVVISL